MFVHLPATKLDYTNASCLIIAILSHGQQGDRAEAFDKSYEIMKTTIYPIMAYNNSIEEVPKLLFVQACKGPNETKLNILEDCEYDESENVENENIKKVLAKSGPGLYRMDATYEGDPSSRSISQGSFFIQSLCEMIKNHGDIKTIQSIAMEVKADVKIKLE